MRRLLTLIFDTSRYSSLIEKDRARAVYAITLMILALSTAFVLFYSDQNTGQSFLEKISSDGLWAAGFTVFYGAGVLSILFIRAGKLHLAEVCPAVMWFSTSVVFDFRAGFADFNTGIGLPIFLSICALLMRERGLLAGLPLTLVTLAVGIANRASLPVPPSTTSSLFDFLSVSLQLLGLSGLLYLFLRFARLSRVEGASKVQIERLQLAAITSQVAQRISRRTALNDVLNQAVEQILISYPDVYHAQIFLVNETKQHARLVASTGEVGQLLLERKHSLPVGSTSVIGQVTATGAAVIARSNIKETIHKRNEFLPDTAVEAAFPLRIGDDIIGALDLQSKTETAFHTDDVPIFQSLADNIAIAIDNARLFDETERRLRENQRLVDQTRQAAAEVERLNQQLTGRFWQDYLSTRGGALGLSVEFSGQKTARRDSEWTPTLQEAVDHNHLVQRQDGGRQVIAVPVRVRGQVIGAMEFELDEQSALSPEDLMLIEEVGLRLGLAAETSRLFEDSQRLAQREALVNEISTRLQASNNVDMALNEAARSLRNTLKANKVAIRLGKPPASNGGKQGVEHE